MLEDFFWDMEDELAPFGSDEGFEALAEFRLAKKNPNISVGFCIAWVIESVGDGLELFRKYLIAINAIISSINSMPIIIKVISK